MSQSRPSRKQQSFWWDLHNVFVILLIKAAGLSDEHLHTDVSLLLLGARQANMLAQACVSSFLRFAWSLTFKALLYLFYLFFLFGSHWDVVTSAVTLFQFGSYLDLSVWFSLWFHDIFANVLTSSHSPPTYKWFILATKLCMCTYWILCLVCLPCNERVGCVWYRSYGYLDTYR